MLNERIHDAHERLDPDGDFQLTVVCECALEQCDETIRMPPTQFEQLRMDVDQFAVIDGHVLHEVEDIVERHHGWMVVRKRGDAAREAARRLS